MASGEGTKRRRKREAIFDAAEARFANQGYRGTRMQDIASDLDLQKPALYYYFDSKEAILVEMIRGRVGDALQAITDLAASDAPAGTTLDRAVRAHLRIFHEHANLYTIFNSEKLTSISTEAASLVDELGRAYEDQWETILKTGVASGYIRDEIDIRVTVKAILGMLNTTLTWFKPDHPLTIGQLSDRYVDLVTASVRRTPPDASGAGSRFDR